MANHPPLKTIHNIKNKIKTKKPNSSQVYRKPEFILTLLLTSFWNASAFIYKLRKLELYKDGLSTTEESRQRSATKLTPERCIFRLSTRRKGRNRRQERAYSYSQRQNRSLWNTHNFQNFSIPFHWSFDFPL